MYQKHRLIACILLFIVAFASSANAAPWKFVIYGDTRTNDSDHREVLQSIVKNTPDYRFIINVGDVVEDGAGTSQWDVWQNACKDVLGEIGQNNVPPEYMVAPGDRENLESQNGRKNWSWYLPGQQRFGNNGAFFVFDYGNARFIILNSNSSITGSQLEMLYDAIDNNQKKWLFAVWHHPIFPFGEKSYEDSIHDNWGIPLYWGGCDIIFTGHEHHYVRSKKLELNGQSNPPLDSDYGTVQIITGNGGAARVGISSGMREYMMAGSTGDFGYTELTVNGDILQLRHINVDGNVVDEEIYTANPKNGVGEDNGISASNEKYPDETKDNAFDGDIDTKWLMPESSGWIQFDYAYDGSTAKVINSYSITSASDFPERDPRDWYMTATNDGTNWTTLDIRSGETFSRRSYTRTFNFKNSKAFSIYRLEISSNNNPSASNLTQLAELELIEDIIIDNCPDDPNKTEPGECGCGVPEGTCSRYDLTVVDGTGDGSYIAGKSVSISADKAPTGKVFDRWVVNSGSALIVNAKVLKTTLTMPTGAASVTAMYKDLAPEKYKLTIGSGRGGGNFRSGAEVDIAADKAPDGKVFDSWVVNSGSPSITNVKHSKTRLTMGAGSATVTARYKNKLQSVYELYVVSGSGGGRYQYGSEVDIIADEAMTGMVFDRWVVSSGGAVIDDVEESSTSFTMPERDVKIRATYIDITIERYVLTVKRGSGGGNYKSGEVVTITANDAPRGMAFDGWVVNNSSVLIDDINESSTILIMPESAVKVAATYSKISSERYVLTVKRGSGGGNYKSGEVVAITANKATNGMVFDSWVSNNSSAVIADVNQSNTTLTMPDGVVDVTATYSGVQAERYTLKVIKGSGGGSYKSGEVVAINAKKAPAGTVFNGWVVNKGKAVITDANKSKTTLKMTARSATITAKYKKKPSKRYTLKVKNGSGDGKYKSGAIVTITANSAPSGKEFDSWVVNNGRAVITDADKLSTTLKMPAGSVKISAKYSDVTPDTFALEVISGSGGGDYKQGQVVTVVASAAPLGQVFDRWVITSGSPELENVNESSTILTMTSGDATVMATYNMSAVISDVITITKAEYKRNRGRMTIEATDSDSGNVTLTVVGYGKMNYDIFRDKYRLDVRHLRRKPPCNIEIISSKGGYATKTVDGVH